MKQVTIPILTCLLLGTPLAQASGVPAEGQVEKLFESLDKQELQKFRILSLRTLEETPPSQTEIDKAIENVRRREEKSQQGVPETIKAQRIEENIKARLSGMTGKTYEKIQEWKSDHLYRIDKAIGWYSMDEAQKKTDFNISYINLEKVGANTVRLTVNHDTKSYEKNTEGMPVTEVGSWKGSFVEMRVALGRVFKFEK